MTVGSVLNATRAHKMSQREPPKTGPRLVSLDDEASCLALWCMFNRESCTASIVFGWEVGQCLSIRQSECISKLISSQQLCRAIEFGGHKMVSQFPVSLVARSSFRWFKISNFVTFVCLSAGFFIEFHVGCSTDCTEKWNFNRVVLWYNWLKEEKYRSTYNVPSAICTQKAKF